MNMILKKFSFVILSLSLVTGRSVVSDVQLMSVIPDIETQKQRNEVID